MLIELEMDKMLDVHKAFCLALIRAEKINVHNLV